MGAVRQLRTFTFDEYLSIERAAPYKSEYLFGSIYSMAGGSANHSFLAANLLAIFVNQLRGTGCRAATSDLLVATEDRTFSAYPDVTVVTGDAVTLPLPASDIAYVNAGVISPPAGWLHALKPGGRLIFPWRPSEEVALSMLVTRRKAGFETKPLMPSWFIPCIGASLAGRRARKLPDRAEARRSRSIWLATDRPPDPTATAIIGDVWFSSEPISE